MKKRKLIIQDRTLRSLAIMPTILDVGWTFAPNINGLQDDDGVTKFIATVKLAMGMLPDQERAVSSLFMIGDGDGVVSNFDDHMKALANRSPADPDLGFSLCQQRRQPILRFLRRAFGVESIYFPRRIILDQNTNPHVLSLGSYADGSWRYSFDPTELFLVYNASTLKFCQRAPTLILR